MSTRVLEELHDLFYPKSIAVVGASPKEAPPLIMSPGNNYIRGSINQLFKGKIYPVHPNAENILGFTSYASIRDIPGEVDLVIFAVPASAALRVMEDCVKKKVKFVHLFTAGFKESGREEFTEIEKHIVDLGKKNGIRIVGPNCMGLYCSEGGLAFQPLFPYKPGPVGFFSQSGQMTAMFIIKATAHKMAISKAISFGNASDLKATDFLSYLMEDDKTEVIGSYLEGLEDDRTFFKAVCKTTRKKPLVVFKGGRSKGGPRAARSHTAAIAGSNKIWQAFCRQTGIISVYSLDEMVYTLSALQRLFLPKGKNVAIIGGAGGGSVTITDMAVFPSFELAVKTMGYLADYHIFLST